MSTTRKIFILFFAVVLVVIGLVIFNIFFANRVSADPKQLFYDSITRDLSEKGVSCTVTKSESGTTQELAVQLDLASKTDAHSTLMVRTDGSTVRTEEVVLKSDDYLRYTQASAAAKDSSGKSADFSKIVGKWIKADKKSSLFGMTSLGGCVVPLADVPTKDETALKVAIEKGEAFKADFANAATATIDNQPVRQYDVTIQPGPYVTFMQNVGSAYGLSDLKSLNIKDYDTKTPRKAIFSVNTKTGRLARIQFTDESRVVTFTDYGKIPQVSAPSTSITNKQAAQLVAQ